MELLLSASCWPWDITGSAAACTRSTLPRRMRLICMCWRWDSKLSFLLWKKAKGRLQLLLRLTSSGLPNVSIVSAFYCADAQDNASVISQIPLVALCEIGLNFAKVKVYLVCRSWIWMRSWAGVWISPSPTTAASRTCHLQRGATAIALLASPSLSSQVFPELNLAENMLRKLQRSFSLPTLCAPSFHWAAKLQSHTSFHCRYHCLEVCDKQN